MAITRTAIHGKTRKILALACNNVNMSSGTGKYAIPRPHYAFQGPHYLPTGLPSKCWVGPILPYTQFVLSGTPLNFYICVHIITQIFYINCPIFSPTIIPVVTGFWAQKLSKLTQTTWNSPTVTMPPCPRPSCKHKTCVSGSFYWEIITPHAMAIKDLQDRRPNFLWHPKRSGTICNLPSTIVTHVP